MTETSTEKTKRAGMRRAVGLTAALLALAGIFFLSIFWGRLHLPAAATLLRAQMPVATEEPAATPEPESRALRAQPGYFPTEDGLFRPEEPLTRETVCRILTAATGKRVSLPSPERGFSPKGLGGYLEKFFEPSDVAQALSLSVGSGTVTRAQGAVCFNRLLGVPAAGATDTYYPDVSPEHWAAAHIAAAAGESDHRWRGGNGRLPAGFVNLDGYLYFVEDDGYFLKNRYLGSLLFDAGGRYTSGNRELDDYVATAIVASTDADMSREECLRAVYEYVRDSFTYFRRHYYKVGDVGWQMEEALTMYSTGKGNCYCYASALWAACRGLGYDAKIVSGTIGMERSPHGWVEIMLDGQRYTFDVEIEMARHRNGYTEMSLYKMSDAGRAGWNYVEATVFDNLVSRETNEALLPR